MIKEQILYIVANDGSDMRVVKEMRSLSQSYDIHFIGVGKRSKESFALDYCKHYTLLKGSHKSPYTLLKMIFAIIYQRFDKKISSSHVVDEQMFIFLFPFLLGTNVVLDVFDSIFLKLNKPNEQWLLLKKIIYFFAKYIIVTDENRFFLLPEFVRSKSLVIPNVPYKGMYETKESNDSMLTICYFGTLLKDRGSSFLLNLIEQHHNVRVIAAGWVADAFTERLIQLEQVSYLGVKTQKEVNQILAKEGDYLLAIYPTNNLNNINASPNKIYDCIHTKTPIIINKKIRVSRFVKEKGFGFVVDDYEPLNFEKIGTNLLESKKKYIFDDSLIDEFCWENFEEKLIKLHKK